MSDALSLLNPSPASLPLEFYDRQHSQHSRWALDTFHHWLTVVHPHIHAATGTVYGGPHGVRQIVFALSRIASALQTSEQPSHYPPNIRRILGGTRRDALRVKEQLSLIIMELRRQVARSSSILQLSFNERAQAWKGEIERQYRARKDAGTLRPGPLNEPRLNMSSGVPTAGDALEAIWKSIKPKRVSDPQIDESLEASRVLPIVPVSARGAVQLDEHSDSAEHIQLPRDSEISAGSSGW